MTPCLFSFSGLPRCLPSVSGSTHSSTVSTYRARGAEGFPAGEFADAMRVSLDRQMWLRRCSVRRSARSWSTSRRKISGRIGGVIKDHRAPSLAPRQAPIALKILATCSGRFPSGPGPWRLAPKGKARHKARLNVGGLVLFSRVQAGTPRNPTNIRLEGWRQVAQSLGERNFLASNLFGVRLSQDFIRAKS
jgi:hypothetical protein